MATAADLQVVPGSNEITFTGLEHNQSYVIRLFNMGNGCFVDVPVTTAMIDCTACPADEDYSYNCGTGPGGCNVLIETYTVNVTREPSGEPTTPFVFNIPNNPTDDNS